MKSKILAVIFSMILISFTGIISASSFDVSVNPKEITAKPGETIGSMSSFWTLFLRIFLFS